MSEDHQPYLSPQEVAEILGVGVSTVKRLVDGGRLPARSTAGKHRRIEPSDVLRLVHSGNYPCANRDALERHLPAEAIDAVTLSERLYQALTQGDVSTARELIGVAYDGGTSIARLADEVVAPVMRRVGHGWATEELDVYQEHCGTMTCMAALQALRGKLPVRPYEDDQPIAVGGGPQGDHYLLANLLIEMMLIEMGWRAVNVGPNTPFASFEKALEQTRPRLLWLSCSYLADESAFVAGYANLWETAARLGVPVAVGGNALTEEVRRHITFEHHGDTLAHLAAFARTLTRS